MIIFVVTPFNGVGEDVVVDALIVGFVADDVVVEACTLSHCYAIAEHYSVGRWKTGVPGVLRRMLMFFVEADLNPRIIAPRVRDGDWKLPIF